MKTALLPLALLLAAPTAHATAPTRTLMDQTVVVSAPTNDLFAMGQRVRFEAPVADNAFVMAQGIDVVDAPVHGDLFAMAETLRIEAPIGGDVYAMAGTVILSSTGSIGGELHAAGGEIVLEGPVGSNAEIAAGRITLAAPIGGDAQFEVGELTYAGAASIGGDLHYLTSTPVAGIDGVVGGTVTFEEAVVEEDGEIAEPEPGIVSTITSWLLWNGWVYASTLLVGFAMLGLGGPGAHRIGRSIGEDPARTLGLGFVVATVLPVAAVIGMVLLVPLPLGVLGMLAFLVGLYVAKLFAAQALGDWVLHRVRPHAVGSAYISMAVGLAIILLVCSIPWLGSLAWFAATVAGFGAMVVAARELTRP